MSHLISLLPIEIAKIIACEPEELAENYDYIKQMLLKCYKLNAESFKVKFFQQVKYPNDTSKDFGFELRNYLQEWLAGLEVNLYDELTDLLIVQQI